jgi:sigma-B regulation protein RsbU (phosphoserine phosphatase)
MTAAAPSRILLCAAESATGDEVRELLQQAGHAVEAQALENAERATLGVPDLIVLDGSGREPEALHIGRQLRARLADAFVPVIFVAGAPDPGVRLAALESGADAVLPRPLRSDELLAQVQALLRLKRLHDRSAERGTEFQLVNQQLERAYRQLNQELELARRIQQSLLPQALPEMPPARFAVHYRPVGRVGGDFYDVFQLDENHVGFYVADVVGHGVPASLLTIFLKKAIRPKEIFGKQYRLVPPNEVLRHLNREMIDQALAENPFITIAYGLYDRRDSSLTFARAGHPYPLYLDRSGAARSLIIPGTLLGLFDAEFPVYAQQLRRGDKVLFYTDGLDLPEGEAEHRGAERLRAEAERYQDRPIGELVDCVARALFDGTPHPDDFTLLGLEIAS